MHAPQTEWRCGRNAPLPRRQLVGERASSSLLARTPRRLDVCATAARPATVAYLKVEADEQAVSG